MSANMKMGKKIRNIRKTQDLSLSALAKKIGKTSSYLSQVERGLAEPSITALREISKALNVPIFYFLVEDQKHNAVVRKEDRKVLKFPGSNLSFELISPDLEHEIEMIEARLEPGASTLDKPLSHNGEEVSIVIQGKMEITIGSESYQLNEGDSIYYNASLPHKITNVGQKDLVFISAITPPNF
ncbi:MAG: cupin domain-containing protein [Halanaerobiales bacterium]